MFNIANLRNRSNRAIANQFVIHYQDGSVGFQSYSTMIAVYNPITGVLEIAESYANHNYANSGFPVHSQTTTRNLNIWLSQFTPWERLEDAEKDGKVAVTFMYVG